MPRVKKNRHAIPPASSVVSPPLPHPQVNFGYDPTGKTESVDIVGAKDGWSEYTLADGTVLRVKAALLDVRLAVGQYSPDGDPIYVFQAALVNQIKVPDRLKRKR
jgi:hypothetical protein